MYTMGKAKPRVTVVSGDNVVDKPLTTRTRGKSKVSKSNTVAPTVTLTVTDTGGASTDSDCMILGYECASACSRTMATRANTCRQHSTVAVIKKLETGTTGVCASNTPVKISANIPSHSDVALSQTQEPIFEVGWDCHSPCDEGIVNTCNVVDIMRTFAHEEHNSLAVHPSSTPPLLGLWIGNTLEDNPSVTTRRLCNHNRFKKGRSVRPAGIKRASDSRALFQRLATVLESHADTPELSPRRSARLVQQSLSKMSTEDNSLSETPMTNESEKCHVQLVSTRHSADDSQINSPRPQLNRSEEDLWTDEELFDNDSFIKATHELFTSEVFLGKKAIRSQIKTSTPVVPSKVGRYTFSLEPPQLSGIVNMSQFQHGALVSSVEKVAKAIYRDHKVKGKVAAAAPKALLFSNNHDKGAVSSSIAVNAKTRSYVQCCENNASTLSALPSRTSAWFNPMSHITTQTVLPMQSNGQGLTKCQSSTAQTFSTCSKLAHHPAGITQSQTYINQPSSKQSKIFDHHSTGNVSNGGSLNGDCQQSKKLLRSCAWKPNTVTFVAEDSKSSAVNGLHCVKDEQSSLAQNVNDSDMNLSDDLLAAVAEPDELLDSQECLLNGAQTCGITASQASTLILSGEHCVTEPGERQTKSSDMTIRNVKCLDTQTKNPAENDSLMSDDDALSGPQVLAMLAEIESTQASEISMCSKDANVNERRRRKQKHHNNEHSHNSATPVGLFGTNISQDVGGFSASQTSVNQLCSSGTQKRCSPEEIQRKKADAIRRRKIRLGLSGKNC